MGKHKVGAVFLAGVLAMGTVMTGCSGKDETEGKTVIEMVQYKPEAVDIFEQFQDEFNATHDDIYLKIDSPNDAMTILKTRFIREDNPDIIGIGGDINYSNFLDADMLMDISDFEGLNDIKEKYLEEFFLTGICLKNMAGRFRPHGQNLRIFVIRSSQKESSHYILVLRIHGLHWHRGMQLQ